MKTVLVRYNLIKFQDHFRHLPSPILIIPSSTSLARPQAYLRYAKVPAANINLHIISGQPNFSQYLSHLNANNLENSAPLKPTNQHKHCDLSSGDLNVVVLLCANRRFVVAPSCCCVLGHTVLTTDKNYFN